MSSVTVLVTGGGGFCGTHLARRLSREKGVRLIGLGRRGPRTEHADLWDGFVKMDLRDRDGLEAVIRSERPAWVFHLAGRFSGTMEEVRADNIDGSKALFEVLRQASPDSSVLVVGSAAEYGPAEPEDLPLSEEHACRPTEPYGLAKHVVTQLALDGVRQGGLQAVVARPFNIIGAGVPSAYVVGAFIERLLDVVDGRAEELRVGNLDAQRDFVSIEDVVDAYVALIRGRFWGEVVNVCSGEPRTILSVLQALLRMTDRPIPVTVDKALLRAVDVPVSYGSTEKARRLLGFVPRVGFDSALEAAWLAAARQ